MNTKLEIMSEGTQNVLSKLNNKINDELNGKFKEVTGGVIRQMKSEYTNQLVLDRDLLIETLAIKNLVPGFYLSEKNSSKLDSYIHNVCANPFGFLIMSNFGVI